MSRSGYSDDCGGWDLIRWRGAVTSAIRGARGQQFLKNLLEALDAMPDKRLIAEELSNAQGYCALGALGALQGKDMAGVDPEDGDAVSKMFNIAPALAAEVVFENDEAYWDYDRVPESAEKRWARVRGWVVSKIAIDSPDSKPYADRNDPGHSDDPT